MLAVSLFWQFLVDVPEEFPIFNLSQYRQCLLFNVCALTMINGEFFGRVP